MQPNILDMTSADNRPRAVDFSALAAAGIWGIVHRASEGTQFIDPYYIDRRDGALQANLLWGALHTINAEDAELQALRFMEASRILQPQAGRDWIMLAVDFTEMSTPAALHQLYTFCGVVDRTVPPGVQIVIRSDDFMRSIWREGDVAPPQMSGVTSFMRLHRYWLNSDLSETVPVPWPWDKFFLRKIVPVIVHPLIGKVGCHIFNGTREVLRANWAGMA